MPIMKFGVIGKILIIAIALVLVLWIYDLCVRTWMKLRNKEQVKTAMAKVVFKEVQTSGSDNSCAYSVCFLTVDGKPVEVFTSEAEYNDLEVGQKGELTYQGMRFIRFAKEQ